MTDKTDKPESEDLDNPNRSRVIFVGVDSMIVDKVRKRAGRRLEISTMQNVEQLLTASGLGTLDCEAVVLGRALSEPVRLAQRIHTLDKNIQIIILAPPDQADEFRRVISFSPFLGDAVSLLSAGNAEKLHASIRRAVKRAHRRCSYRRGAEPARTSTGTVAHQAQELSQYLGKLLEHAPIGMLTLDANGRIQTLNRLGRELLGVSEREVFDTPFMSFFMPVDQIRLQRVLAGDENFGGHFRVAGDSGQPRFVEVNASEFLSRSGQTGSMIILHDVTDRVNAEQARREAAAALQASEDRFIDLADVLRLIPWEADAKTHRFTFIGEQVVDILGYPRDKWYEEDFWEHVVHPEDRQRALKTLHSNTRRLQNFDYQYRAISADGRTLWIHDIVNVIRDNFTNPVKLRGIMVDVTEKHRLPNIGRQHHHG